MHAGEILHLMAAGRAARHEHRAGVRARAPPAAAGARRSRARRRSDRGRSRTIRPCRSSRRRDRRPSRRECATSSAFAGASRPIDFWWQWPCSRIVGGPGSERQRRLGQRAVRANSSNSTHASRDAPARGAAPSPRSSDGASSRTADRQLGSKKTSALPRAASGKSAVGVACGAARAPRRADPARSAAGRSRRSARAPARQPALSQHVGAGHADARDCSSW